MGGAVLDEQKYWVWLSNINHISSAKIALLLENFSSPHKIYEAERKDFEKIAGINERDIEELIKKDTSKAEKIIEKTLNMGAYILCYDDKLYPSQLRHCYNPPYVLYVMGEKTDWSDKLCISVVGARKCSEYGLRATEKICTEMAKKGVVIVSGMARGIDSQAHRSALMSGAKTVAFLGNGLDVIYPPENEELMHAIAQNGAVITEFPPETPPYARNFPIRNRLIAAFSRGVLVVEAQMSSGTLITANWALENGKDVYAVPGDYDRDTSVGCNSLIREGAAKLTVCGEDILNEYVYELENMNMGLNGMADGSYEPEGKAVNIARPVNEHKNENKKAKKDIDINSERYINLDESQKIIIEALAQGDKHIDEICRISSLSASEAGAALMLMELDGLVSALAGKMYALNV